jgi:hypothetical protein
MVIGWLIINLIVDGAIDREIESKSMQQNQFVE